jgi:hypothetical protein
VYPLPTGSETFNVITGTRHVTQTIANTVDGRRRRLALLPQRDAKQVTARLFCSPATQFAEKKQEQEMRKRVGRVGKEMRKEWGEGD